MRFWTENLRRILKVWIVMMNHTDSYFIFIHRSMFLSDEMALVSISAQQGRISQICPRCITKLHLANQFEHRPHHKKTTYLLTSRPLMSLQKQSWSNCSRVVHTAELQLSDWSVILGWLEKPLNSFCYQDIHWLSCKEWLCNNRNGRIDKELDEFWLF